ncbi:hypothetical protein D3C73_398440 [compost metagenome]
MKNHPQRCSPCHAFALYLNLARPQPKTKSGQIRILSPLLLQTCRERSHKVTYDRLKAWQRASDKTLPAADGSRESDLWPRLPYRIFCI